MAGANMAHGAQVNLLLIMKNIIFVAFLPFIILGNYFDCSRVLGRALSMQTHAHCP